MADKKEAAAVERIDLRLPQAIMDGSPSALDEVERAAEMVASLRAQWALAGLSELFAKFPQLTGLCVELPRDRDSFEDRPSIHTNKFTNSDRSMARPLGSDKIELDRDAMEEPRRRGPVEGPHAELIEAVEAWAKSAMARSALGEIRKVAYVRPDSGELLAGMMGQGLSPARYASWEAAWLGASAPGSAAAPAKKRM